MTELEQKLREIADEKDSKILPENIKKDVQIFDITGTYEGSGQEINNQDKTITENGEYTADTGYTGLGTVTVNVSGGGTPDLEDLTVIPSTVQQTFNHQGKDGYDVVSVNAVTSAIDNNIQAENIKKDVEILGITGTLEAEIILSINNVEGITVQGSTLIIDNQ